MDGQAARTFEELRFYQEARSLTNTVYALTREGTSSSDRGLVDQVRRACVSIMSNIAEGFERRTKTEFIQFLYIAKGSCGEVRAQLQIASDQGYITAEHHRELCNEAQMISGMISRFIGHLQKSNYQGEKFARPRRQLAQEVQNRVNTLRQAQLVNIEKRRMELEQEATTTNDDRSVSPD